MKKPKRNSIFGGASKAPLPPLQEKALVSLSLVYDFLNHRVGSRAWLYRDGGGKKLQFLISSAITNGTIASQLQKGQMDLDTDVHAVCGAVKQVLASHAPMTGYEHYDAFLEAAAKDGDEALRKACGSTLAPVMARALHELCGHLLTVSETGGRGGAIGAHAQQLTRENLAHVFAPLLLRRTEDKGKAASPKTGEVVARHTAAEKIFGLPWTSPAARATTERARSWTSGIQDGGPGGRDSEDGLSPGTPVFRNTEPLAFSKTAGPALGLGAVATLQVKAARRRSSSGDLSARSLKVTWGTLDAPEDEDALRNAFLFAGPAPPPGPSPSVPCSRGVAPRSVDRRRKTPHEFSLGGPERREPLASRPPCKT